MLDLFIGQIRGGFRFLMAAGSQLVESLGEKAGPGPAREKNPFFLRSHAVQLARVSHLQRRHRLRPQTLHQGYGLSRDSIGSLRKWAGWEGEG